MTQLHKYDVINLLDVFTTSLLLNYFSQIVSQILLQGSYNCIKNLLSVIQT